MANVWEYRGRWALVTGASAGIGAVFARRLAARGMHLVLSARREERLLELAEQLRESHAPSVEVIPADLGVPGEAARLWRAAADGRRIDLLVNNAGFGARGQFEQIPVERQVEMVQLNCTSLLELAHAALREMRERGGGVINVASIAAFQPVATLATYAATKAFVLSLSESLWTETRGSGVRVLALCPGRTPTEFQEIAGTGSAHGSFGVRSGEAVVDAALRAFEADKPYVVPGLENYLASWLVRVLPRGAVGRAVHGMVRRAAAKR